MFEEKTFEGQLAETINLLENKIADLEAKLAEMTEKYNACQEARKLEIEFNQQDKAELKQQLDESKNTILNIKEANDSFSFMAHYICEHLGKNNICPKDVNDFVESFDQLKQQLAEKEKEIEYFKKQASKFNNEAQKYYEDAYCNDFHNQDKISFAVDVLEEIADCSNYINSKLDFECGSYVSEKAIRDKIKQLKEGK